MVATYLLFSDECLNHKVFDNRHEKMNGDWHNNTSKIFFLKSVDLRQYPCLDFQHFFNFQERWKKAIIPKLNPVYWIEFVFFSTVRTASTQLPTGFEIEKKDCPKQTSAFYFYLSLWDEKKLLLHGTHYSFSPSSQLKFWNYLILLHFPCFSQRISKDTNILHILVCMQNNRLKAY